MEFASDNTSGVAPEILQALTEAAGGYAPAYGDDELTAQLDERFGALFEHDVRVFPVVSGTAANSLSLAVLTPPWGLMLCHEQAHVYVDEAGAPELFSGGARLAALPGADGKIDVEALRLAALRGGHGVHSSPPSALTLTQATELGTVYSPDEVATRATIAHEHGIGVHMDGARFANAVASLGCTPAEVTWRSGVDIMSFGATKNGAMGAEAVVVFDQTRVGELERLRKRSGHLLSKMRFASAQLLAYVTDGLWLRLASHANQLAALLSRGLAGIPGVEVATPTQANEVFVFMSDELIEKLQAAGAHFYVERVGDRPAVRLVVSWSSTTDDVETFLAAVRAHA